MSKHEKLVDVFQIIEWRDNSVYKTKFIEQRWVDMDEKAPEGFSYAPLSTNDPNVMKPFRRKS